MRKFPFLPLDVVEDEKSKFEIVVWHRDDWVLLNVPRTPFRMSMVEFAVDSESEGRVKAKDRTDSVWMFCSTDDCVFEWIAELKDEHAQRIANDVSGSFARVGVSESEWVRKSGRSS